MKIMKPYFFLTIVFITITIIFLFVYFWASSGETFFTDIWNAWQEHRKFSGETRKMQRYYENLSKAALSSRQVILDMIKLNGLPKDNIELCNAVEYYVYQGDPNVIKQLVANLSFEVELSLPEESKNGRSVYIRNTWGKSYYILQNRWNPSPDISSPPGILKHVSPVLHEEFHRLTEQKEADAHLIYLITELISSNEPYLYKVTYSKGNAIYTDEGGHYANTNWYTKDSVKKDVLAYLRTYVNYRNYPTLREIVVWDLQNYPNNWFDITLVEKVLEMADEMGVDPAYELFITNFGQYK